VAPAIAEKQVASKRSFQGPALQRFYAGVTGNNITLKEIVSRYQQNTDEVATQTIQRLCRFFGKAVSVVTNLLDPDVIVVGGGVGNIDVIYTEGLKSLNEFIFNNRVDVPILKPSLGDSAGVFGAAALVAPNP
jgi:predicted NBD/HSP70 family sugar kinase